jgi:alkylhydroperoxidase/carboxymuconolactone decarboxylase family protein YurZ
MGQTIRFQEILRRLAIIDEGFVVDHTGLELNLPSSELLNPKTAALVRISALVAIGSPGVCVEWSTSRALAAGASEDDIVDVLLAIAPVVGLGKIVHAVPDMAVALGYDVETALIQRDNDTSHVAAG